MVDAAEVQLTNIKMTSKDTSFLTFEYFIFKPSSESDESRNEYFYLNSQGVDFIMIDISNTNHFAFTPKTVNNSELRS